MTPTGVLSPQHEVPSFERPLSPFDQERGHPLATLVADDGAPDALSPGRRARLATPLPAGPKLNIGCGPVQPAGWVNLDGSNRARFASRFWPVDKALVALGVLPKTSFGPHITIHDLFKPLPFADNSVACIYAGEVWEHFEYPDTVRLTAECFRVLAPGGVLRICVPDGPTFWGRYLTLYQAERAKPAGTRSAAALRAHVDLYFREIMTRRVWLGSIGHKHKWQFDDVQLAELFESVGLTDVDRMPYHVSRIPDVSAVESSDFCIVEGTKPFAPARQP